MQFYFLWNFHQLKNYQISSHHSFSSHGDNASTIDEEDELEEDVVTSSDAASDVESGFVDSNNLQSTNNNNNYAHFMPMQPNGGSDLGQVRRSGFRSLAHMMSISSVLKSFRERQPRSQCSNVYSRTTNVSTKLRMRFRRLNNRSLHCRHSTTSSLYACTSTSTINLLIF